VKVGVKVRVAGDPRAIDRNHSGLHQASGVTQLQHIREQVGERLLVAADEARDRHIVRNEVAGDHPKRDVLAAVTLDRTRRAHTTRTRIQHKRQHQRRLIRSTTVTIGPIRGIERAQAHLLDRIDHKPRQMIWREPIPNVGRQQKPLLTTTLNEVLRHTEIVFNGADGTPL
jgi:hypothetical protein